MSLLSLFYLFHPTAYWSSIIFASLPLFIGIKGICLKRKEFFHKNKTLKRIHISIISSLFFIVLAILFIYNPEIILTLRKIIFFIIGVLCIYFLPTLIAYFMDNEQIDEIFRINKFAYLIFPWLSAMFLLSVDVKKFVKHYVKKGDKKNVVIQRKHKLLLEYEELPINEKRIVNYFIDNYSKNDFFRYKDVYSYFENANSKIPAVTLSRALKKLTKKEIIYMFNPKAKRKKYRLSEEFLSEYKSSKIFRGNV